MKDKTKKIIPTKEQLDVIMEVANSACQEDPYVEYEYLPNGVPEMRVYDRYGLCQSCTTLSVSEVAPSLSSSMAPQQVQGIAIGS